MGIKFVVWDWMAGMTDSYIIKEYESMTFKRLDLR
jgi:dGTP triphosphohydrolase